jgi:2-polyprenyl-6-methoxyphenol hydroxylase-like FAD-dependent oxidoreductase
VTQVVEIPVLVVGAGPIGLGQAIDLGWRGVDCMLIEQTDGVPESPKLGLVAVRTMEIFRRWGIAESILNAGFPNDFELSMLFATSMAGHLLARDPYPSVNDAPKPPWSPEKRIRCPQIFLDPALARAVKAQPSTKLRYLWKLERFEQYPTHVVAHVTDLANNEPVEIRAQYMIACDGAASSIREALGIKMEGNAKMNYSMGILIRSPDLLQHFDKGEAERIIFVGPEGTWGNLTIVDRDNWRITVLGSALRFDMNTFDPHVWVKRALGRDDVPYEVVSAIPWRRSELTAERYRSGRVMLVGDSAHVMSPTSGMGMNTGVGDLFDLGWKLDAVLRGWADEKLLDTYDVERRPIAIRNATFATHNWKAWIAPTNCQNILEDTPEASRLRSEIGEQMKDALRDEWVSWGVQVGYRYENSPICIGDGTPPTPDDYKTYVPTARPGSRAPHAWLADGRSTLDLFEQGLTLLCFEGADKSAIAALKEAASSRRVPLSVVPIEDRAIAALYEQPMVLVRPDGHVAWRGKSAKDAQYLIDTARGAFVGEAAASNDNRRARSA